MITRRRFLATGAAAALAPLVPNAFAATIRQHTPAPDPLGNWPAVRAQFDLAPGMVHLSSFYLASHPKPVRDAIEAYRRVLDANPYLEVEHRMFEPGPDNLQFAIRDALAGYLGAHRDELALTGNTTTGLALVYAGLPLRAGDEILTTTHDHYSHHESIRFATQRTGARTRRIALYETSENASVDGILSRLRAALRPETRVLGLTWVHSCTGVRIPVREIAGMLAEVNRTRPDTARIRLVLDGVHGLGAVDARVAELGCDFFCAGTHKWMMAPRGTGIVWARTREWARLRQTVPSFSNVDAWNAWASGGTPAAPATGFDHTPGGFHAYEHQWAMTAAFAFHERIGRARVAARIRELNMHCKNALAAIPGVRVVTPLDPALSAGIVCFDVHGKSAEEVGAALVARRIVAGASPYQPSHARFAPSLVNTPEDVDAGVRAVAAIAGA